MRNWYVIRGHRLRLAPARSRVLPAPRVHGEQRSNASSFRLPLRASISLAIIVPQSAHDARDFAAELLPRTDWGLPLNNK